MRSWVTLQPGETVSCVGCHESKNEAPPVGAVSAALRAGPEDLAPWYGPPRGFGFEREVQPILDRRCVGCHHVDEPPKYRADGRRPAPGAAPGAPPPPPAPGVKPAFSLRGGPGTWSAAYRALAHPAVASWVSPQSQPTMLAPYHAGAAKSKLIQMLEEGHHGVRLSDEDLERLAAWMDLLVPCFGDYAEGLSPADRERYNGFLAKRRRWEAQERANIEALLAGPPQE
jgi:hypothetical protein